MQGTKKFLPRPVVKMRNEPCDYIAILLRYVVLLADRTNGRAYATLLRPSVVVCRL